MLSLKELSIDSKPLVNNKKFIERDFNNCVDDIHVLTGYDKRIIINVLNAYRLSILETLAGKLPCEMISNGTEIRIGLPCLGDLLVTYRDTHKINPKIKLYGQMHDDIVKALYYQDTPLLDIIECNFTEILEDRYANFVDDRAEDKL